MPKSIDDIIRGEFGKILPNDHPENFDTIPLGDLGIDSLEFFETVMILEDEHGIIIPESELHGSITLAELISLSKRRDPI